MDHRPKSPTYDAPEAVPDQPRSTSAFVGFNDFEYYDPPSSAYDRRLSPAPQYGQDDTSPKVSARSPPPISEYGQSPHRSGTGFSNAHTVSPLITYTEDHANAPEVIYEDEGKEVVYTEQPPSKAPSYHTYTTPTPGIRHQNSGDRPQVWTPIKQEESEDDEIYQKKQPKRPFYKRWLFILVAVTLVVFVAAGVALGVIFARRNSNSGSSGKIGPNKLGVDINTSVGGDINNAYYSKSGAFNGSGIAIAGANTEYDQSIYAYYQDYQGTIQYALMDPQAKWNLVGPVNAGSYQALNGTPLSAVQHQLGNKLVWHVFYIDVNLILRERIITNITTNGPSPIWTDGPLNALNLKAWNSTTIGMQGCYWGNYYGAWSYDTSQASAGIHLWYASDATTFEQYSWTNGTDSWSRDRSWTGLSGNGGVGCQTWDTGMTEYVWFVDESNSLAMYWQDNNKSATATPTHPISEWTKVEIGVDNVQKDSSLGYTNYMIWQANDTTIRGANIAWNAENTKIANGTGENNQDTWTLQNQGANVLPVRGTHLSITAVKTASQGALLLAFFQGFGDDVEMYTRDAVNSGALWQVAAQNPVQSKIGS